MLSNWPRMLTRVGPKMSSMNSSKSWLCRRSSRLKSNKERELTPTLWFNWALQVLSCNLLASLRASMSSTIGMKWSPTLGYFVSTLIAFAASSCTFFILFPCFVEQNHSTSWSAPIITSGLSLTGFTLQCTET